MIFGDPPQAFPSRPDIPGGGPDLQDIHVLTAQVAKREVGRGPAAGELARKSPGKQRQRGLPKLRDLR